MSIENNTIVLIGQLHDNHEERRCASIVKPGYLMDTNADGKVIPAATYGAKGELYVAKEDYLQGKTINDAYAVGDLVFIHKAKSGNKIALVLAAGQNVAKGDQLISNGDGTVVKYTSDSLANVTAQSAAVTNTTTESTFSNGTITIPAGSLRAGDQIRIRGRVTFPTTNSTDTALVKLKIGSTVIFATAATDVADADACVFDALLTIRTVGASGTMVASGTFSIGVPGTATVRSFSLTSTSIDTTAALSITVTVTWSVASASNIAYLQQLSANSSPAGVLGGKQPIAKVDVALDLSAEEDPDFVKAWIL